MNNIFSFRLDEETSEILRILAQNTLRSRSGFLRWLVHDFAAQRSLSSPKLMVSKEIPQSSDINNQSDDDKLEVQG